MKYIKKISCEELMDGFESFCRNSTEIDISRIKGLRTSPSDICFSDINNNIYFLFQTRTVNLIDFAIDKYDSKNIRAMYETLYELAKMGFYTIRLEGFIGQYRNHLKSFGHFVDTDCSDSKNEAFMWDIGNPEVMEKLLARVER